MIETTNLTKSYDQKVVVNNLNLNIGAGEVFGFLGPNGAGKTTTIKMLMGLIQPTSGTGRVCGFDIVHQVLDFCRSCGVLLDPPAFTILSKVRHWLSSLDARTKLYKGCVIARWLTVHDRSIK